MVEVDCYNKKCRHKWDYKGNSKDRITCPKCLYKLRLDKAKLGYLPNLPNRPTQLKQDKDSEFERVYFPDGFNCLVHKDIAPQFKELTLEDLQEEDPIIEFEIDEKPVPGSGVYVDQFGEKVEIREIEDDREIRVIPIDPIKILEHQQNF